MMRDVDDDYDGWMNYAIEETAHPTRYVGNGMCNVTKILDKTHIYG